MKNEKLSFGNFKRDEISSAKLLTVFGGGGGDSDDEPKTGTTTSNTGTGATKIVQNPLPLPVRLP